MADSGDFTVGGATARFFPTFVHDGDVSLLWFCELDVVPASTAADAADGWTGDSLPAKDPLIWLNFAANSHFSPV